MRIIDEIGHPRMKISIFKMNDKLSIKFEKNLVEHIVKLRQDSPLNKLDLLKAKFGSAEFLHQIEFSIDSLVKTKIEWEEMEIDPLDNFEEII